MFMTTVRSKNFQNYVLLSTASIYRQSHTIMSYIPGPSEW
jgi:hypothetical protein